MCDVGVTTVQPLRTRQYPVHLVLIDAYLPHLGKSCLTLLFIFAFCSPSLSTCSGVATAPKRNRRGVEGRVPGPRGAASSVERDLLPAGHREARSMDRSVDHDISEEEHPDDCARTQDLSGHCCGLALPSSTVPSIAF